MDIVRISMEANKINIQDKVEKMNYVNIKSSDQMTEWSKTEEVYFLMKEELCSVPMLTIDVSRY